jgi:CRP-like cAMP-binding protein
MDERFKTYLQIASHLQEKEILQIYSLATPRDVAKNELLLKEGTVCHHKFFLLNGLLQVFKISNNGNEHIIRFAQENNWIVDKESYDKNTPSKTSISTIEASTILVWNKTDFDRLNNHIPALKAFTDQITAQHIYKGNERLLTTLSASPEEKYQDFVQNHPDLLRRLPLKMIASYLGISTRTLDRIRHDQAKIS